MQRVKKLSCMIIIIFAMVSTSGCRINHNPEPKEESDYSEVQLDQAIDSVISGVPYAIQRVKKWRDTMALNFINVGFEGKEQIAKRKGKISYFFYKENVTDELDADAEVMIDMENSSIISFISTYGTGKQLIGSEISLNTDDWKLDINEVFDIAEEELGKDYLEGYDNPKVVLLCSDTWWDFAVYKSSTAPYEEVCIEISPITGEIKR